MIQLGGSLCVELAGQDCYSGKISVGVAPHGGCGMAINLIDTDTDALGGASIATPW